MWWMNAAVVDYTKPAWTDSQYPEVDILYETVSRVAECFCKHSVVSVLR